MNSIYKNGLPRRSRLHKANIYEGACLRPFFLDDGSIRTVAERGRGLIHRFRGHTFFRVTFFSLIFLCIRVRLSRELELRLVPLINDRQYALSIPQMEGIFG